MNRGRWLLTSALVVSLAATAWLYRDNRRLRADLSARTNAVPATRVAAATATVTDAGDGAGEAKRGKGSAGSFLRAFGAAAGRERPALEPRKKETRQERRLRRQKQIAAMLGRADGETAEAYRARMVPMIEMGLAGPRKRMKDLRAEMEKIAGIDSDQSKKLDGVFDDVFKEVTDLTNRAVKDGDLTPYEPNWSGILSYAGGLGAVLGNADARIGGILTPEQIAALRGSGFQWGEYLGVNMPWEDLDAPPPAPGKGGS